MDQRAEVHDFLLSRRAKVTPEQVGLPAGTGRRVPGLRRSEVATLAGMSVEYYTKLERGHIAGASPEVLDSLARALLLDEAERAHLFALAAVGSPSGRPPRRRSVTCWRPGPELTWMLDGFTAGPAFIRNGRMDLLATNVLARAFYTEVFQAPGRGNIARHTFLDPRAFVFYPDWESIADVTVAILRTETARDPRDVELHELIGELSTCSQEFRSRWARHDVRHHGSGSKTFCHPVAGEMTLAYQGMDLEAEHGLTFTTYTPEPGSPSASNMALLASWAASQDQAQLDQAEALPAARG